MEFGKSGGYFVAEGREVVTQRDRWTCFAGTYGGARSCFRSVQIFTAPVFYDPSRDQLRLPVRGCLKALNVNNNLVIDVRAEWPRIFLELLGFYQGRDVFCENARKVFVERFAPSVFGGKIELIRRGESDNFGAPQVIREIYGPDTDRQTRVVGCVGRSKLRWWLVSHRRENEKL